MPCRRTLAHRALPLALAALVLAVGCASEDDTIAGSGVGAPPPTGGTEVTGNIPGKGGTPTPTPTGSATEEASPSPTPTASPSPTPTVITGGTDTETTPAPVPTIDTGATPTPSATPIGQLGAPLHVQGAPRRIAFPANSVYPWVLTSSEARQLNANGNTVAQFASGLNQPRLLALARNDLWIANAGNGELFHVSEGFMGARTLQASYAIGTSPVALAVDDAEAWAVDAGGTLTRINLATRAVATYSIASPTAIALAGADAWVTGSPDKLYRLSRATGAVLGTYTVGSAPIAVAVDRHGTVWTANEGDGDLSRLGAGAPSPGAPIPLGGRPVALAADGDRVWAGLSSPSQAAWFGLDGAYQGSTSLPAAPGAMAIDALGRVWFAAPGSGTLTPVWGR